VQSTGGQTAVNLHRHAERDKLAEAGAVIAATTDAAAAAATYSQGLTLVHFSA
jgi:hypothetical protein